VSKLIVLNPFSIVFGAMSSTGIPGRMNCCLTVMSVCLMAV